MKYICPVCKHTGSNGIGEPDRFPRPLCDKCDYKVTMLPSGERVEVKK